MTRQNSVDIKLSLKTSNQTGAAAPAALYLELGETRSVSRSQSNNDGMHVDVPSDPEDGSVDE